MAVQTFTSTFLNAFLLGILLLSAYFGLSAIDTSNIPDAFAENPGDATVGVAAYAFAFNGLVPAKSFFNDKFRIPAPDVTDLVGVVIFALIGLLIINFITISKIHAFDLLLKILIVAGFMILGWFIWKLLILPLMLKWAAPKIGLTAEEAWASVREAQKGTEGFVVPLIILNLFAIGVGLKALFKHK